MCVQDGKKWSSTLCGKMNVPSIDKGLDRAIVDHPLSIFKGGSTVERFGRLSKSFVAASWWKLEILQALYFP